MRLLEERRGKISSNSIDKDKGKEIGIKNGVTMAGKFLLVGRDMGWARKRKMVHRMRPSSREHLDNEAFREN